MKEDSSRREFLRNASLAGVALVAGGAVAGVAGCDGQECKEGHKKVCVWWDDTGHLYVDDPDLAAKLYQVWRAKAGQDPPLGGPPIKGISVSLPDPNSPGNKLNSLCNC